MTTNPPVIEQQPSQQVETTNDEKSFKWLIILLAVVAVCLLAMYFMNFHGGWGNQGDFGTFGDFFGGVLNPILGFATVGLLVWSLKAQREALAVSQRELATSNKQLAISNEELALTRNELKETKEEAALSRQAMQDQVEHLQKEAELNEMTRVMADLRQSLQQILSYSYPLTNEQREKLRHDVHSLRRTSLYEIEIKIKDILYDGTRGQLIYNILRESIAKEYNNAKILSNDNYWADLEIIIVNFANVSLMYSSVSSSQNLAQVYLAEAQNMLKTLRKIFESELIEQLLGEISDKIADSLNTN